jgi:chitin disaccharide deacetylase
LRVRHGAALIITADDYGYREAYDRGILEVAGARAVDAVSAMVTREGIEPEPLLDTQVEIGLHLELPVDVTRADRAGVRGRQVAVAALREQLGRFEELFGRPPQYLDGHHHCHAQPGLGTTLAREARRLRLPMRSVSPEHRRLLRRQRVATPDLLVGRLTEEAEAALPEELRPAIEDGGEFPMGVTEWMVHPGHSDPDAGSGYDRAREEDLDLLLGLSLDPALTAARLTHVAALG